MFILQLNDYPFRIFLLTVYKKGFKNSGNMNKFNKTVFMLLMQVIVYEQVDHLYNQSGFRSIFLLRCYTD